MSLEEDLLASPAFTARFEIGKRVGEGAMGAVFIARDTYHERDVAIKVALHEEAGSGDVDQRLAKLWVNETRLAGRLKHPHIVTLHEAGQTERFSYLVMEFVDGGTLKDYTRVDTLLPIERVVDAIFKVARALEYANTMGLLHRDIKPANVLLTAGGSPKVSDFGSCYFLEGEETQVMEVGTIPYVPPEQLSGTAPNLQSDIYAVGVMAYQLLTGNWPFTATSQAAMMFHKMHEDAIGLETRRADIPPELRFAVHRAMHRDPAVRYPSWTPFCEDLARLIPALNAEVETVTESARFEMLKSIRFFAGFSETDLWEAVRIAQVRRVAKDTAIFEEGSPGASMFVLLSGDLGVRRQAVSLGIMHAGECFGELAFVEEPNHIRSATVTALAESIFVEFDAEAVRWASSAMQAALSRAIMKSLAERLRKADARYISTMEQPRRLKK